MYALENQNEILEAQRGLKRQFQDGAQLVSGVQIGYQGGAVHADVYWHRQLGIWGSLNDGPLGGEKDAGRFWNALGTQDPHRHGSNLSIVCEANPAHSGLNRRVAGLFARDDHGRTYLLHRGRLNGMTMKAFWREYQGEDALLGDGQQSHCAVVAKIGTSTMTNDIADFGKQAERVKLIARGR